MRALPHERRSSLLELTIIVTLAACGDEQDGTTGLSSTTAADSTTTIETTTSTTSSSSSSSTTGSADTSSDSTTTTDTAGSTTSSSSDSTGPGGGSTTSRETMGVPCDPEPVPAVCQTAHDHWVVCVYGRYVPDDSYLYDCSCRLQLAQMEAGDTCVALLEDWYACVAQAECMDIVLAEHCPDELAAIQAECPRFSPP